MGLFSRKPPEPPQPKTRITRGTHIQGDAESKQDFTLEGTFEGSLRCGSEVRLGSSGTFSGELRAESLRCAGSGEGLAQVRGVARFEAGASWDGTFRTGLLSVEKGAQLRGTFVPGDLKPGGESPSSPEWH